MRRAQPSPQVLPRGCGGGDGQRSRAGRGPARAPPPPGAARGRVWGAQGPVESAGRGGGMGLFALYLPLHFISRRRTESSSLCGLCVVAASGGPRSSRRRTGPSAVPPLVGRDLCACGSRDSAAADAWKLWTRDRTSVPGISRLPRNHWTWAWDLISEGHSFLLRRGDLITEVQLKLHLGDASWAYHGLSLSGSC